MIAVPQAPHAESTKDVLTQLMVDARTGLSSAEAQRRLEEYGRNEFSESQKPSFIRMLFKHFINAINFILYAVLVLSLVNREWIDAGAVVVVILVNSLIGLVQDIKSTKAIEALRSMMVGTATVLRDGATLNININDVALGDIVVLTLGDRVPADLRIIEANALEIDEALLTGEAEPVAKYTAAVAQSDAALGDRINMVYRQCNVVNGKGLGVVIATGRFTEIGKIARRLQQGSGPGQTALMKLIDRIMYFLFGLALVLAVIIFGVDDWEFESESILYASATGIAILPEALVAVATVTRAVSVRTLAKKRALVRNMTALEVLGSVTDICSDKTGTLTEGKMVVRRLWLADSPTTYAVSGGPMQSVAEFGLESSTPPQSAAVPWDTDFAQQDLYVNVPNEAQELAFVASTCNNVRLTHEIETRQLEGTGNPTEIALQVLAFKLRRGNEYWNSQGLRVLMEFPFDSTVKCMTRVVTTDAGGFHVVTKGAPERVINFCPGVDRALVSQMAAHLAMQGFRVLALAVGKPEGEAADLLMPDRLAAASPRTAVQIRKNFERDLRFLGLVGILDPPRAESAASVRECQEAGIRVRMLTGDHQSTATSIAMQLGILTLNDGAGSVMNGPDFDRLSQEELSAMTELPLVVARCSPESKVKMIEALHARKRICAMTGDGVNDSPALKAADVGACMGISGTDVAKGASDIILTDDNFATIVHAVEEGRHIFSSIQKFTVHLLASNIAEMIILMLGLIWRDRLGLSVFPLSPLEVLWINMFTGSPPAIGIAMDTLSPTAMKAPPQRRLFTLEVIIDQCVYGIIMGGLTLMSYLVVLYGVGDGDLGENCNTSSGLDCDLVYRARTTTFATLNHLLLVLAYTVRDSRRSLFQMTYYNHWLNLAVLFGLLSILVWIYIPSVAKNIFKHGQITWEWGLVAAAIFGFIFLVELYKLAKRRCFPLPSADLGSGAALALGTTSVDESKMIAAPSQPGAASPVAVADAPMAIANAPMVAEAPMAPAPANAPMVPANAPMVPANAPMAPAPLNVAAVGPSPAPAQSAASPEVELVIMG